MIKTRTNATIRSDAATEVAGCADTEDHLSLPLMTTIATRMTEIQELEGFAIVFLDENDNEVPVKTNGYPRFNFERRMKGTATVQEWKEQRFAREYPGKRCMVLLADGSEAYGQTTLVKVRTTYEEGAPEEGMPGDRAPGR